MDTFFTNHLVPGHQVRVLRTGQIGSIESIDLEWARLFPHKGPMLVVNLGSERRCFSLCDLELINVPTPAMRASEHSVHRTCRHA